MKTVRIARIPIQLEGLSIEERLNPMIWGIVNNYLLLRKIPYTIIILFFFPIIQLAKDSDRTFFCDRAQSSLIEFDGKAKALTIAAPKSVRNSRTD